MRRRVVLTVTYVPDENICETNVYQETTKCTSFRRCIFIVIFSTTCIFWWFLIHIIQINARNMEL